MKKLLLALPLALLAAVPASAQVKQRAPSAEDRRPNNPKVPDAYAIDTRFDRVVVMRMKFGTDLLTGMETLVRQQHIRDGVILSGIGSLRGYVVHNVAGRDYPVPDVFTRAPTTAADLIGMNGLIVNGKIHAHIIMGIGKDARSYAGHLEHGTQVLTYVIVTVGVLDKPLGRVDDETYR